MRSVVQNLGQSLALTVLAGVLAAVVNLARSDGLPWVARAPYEIYRETVTQEPLRVTVPDLPQTTARLFILDARNVEAYAQGHLPGARSFPFDPSRSHSLPAPLIAEAKAAGPNRVLVYGDPADEQGFILALLFAEAGCFGVRYLDGGLPAWVKAGRPVETGGGS